MLVFYHEVLCKKLDQISDHRLSMQKWRNLKSSGPLMGALGRRKHFWVEGLLLRRNSGQMVCVHFPLTLVKLDLGVQFLIT